VYIDEYLGGFGVEPVGWEDCTPVYNANEANGSKPSVYVSLEPYNNGVLNYEPQLSITGLLRDVWIKYDLDLINSKVLGFANAVQTKVVSNAGCLTQSAALLQRPLWTPRGHPPRQGRRQLRREHGFRARQFARVGARRL